MKFFIPVFVLLFISEIGIASRPDSSRTELLSLLNDRKILFESYTQSLSKKSGFFGNRTKNDMKESQEKLVAIIRADNKIMSTLNRTLDYRNFEKLNMSYDVNSYEDRLRNLSILNDTLNKQNIFLQSENKSLTRAMKMHELYFSILILFLLFIAGRWLKKYFGK
jgi:hypothetical protein